MDKEIVSGKQKRFLAIGTVIALLFCAYFLSSFASLIVLAGILAFLFNPVYKRLLRRMKPGSAAALTLIISVLAIVIPLFAVMFFAGLQLKNNFSDLSAAFSSADIGSLGNKLINGLNEFLNAIPFVNVNITEQSVIDAVNKVAQNIGQAALDAASGFVSSFASLVTNVIIYMYVFVAVLKNSDTMVSVFRKLNPIGEGISDLYLSKSSAMVQGTVKGQFIIATIQGFLGAATIALVGYPEYFFVLFALFSMLNIIPLGAGIVAIPLGIMMMIFGNAIGGLIVFAEHLLINTNIDNILRPMLVPKQARLNTALMMLSVFAGIRLFGFLGIIIGPTLMILIVTTVQVYLHVFTDYKNPSEKAKKQS
ncbi:MAG: hypothetical protein QG628_343 [Patescibacteria group bacterium]|jgi:predicted PurR-regulated permease PerM|nr:hypothetical protein [Patescibacteria group bacterium]